MFCFPMAVIVMFASNFKIKLKKLKKTLAFCFRVVYYITCRCEKTDKLWSVGQAAKTSPSHGENRGSIPLQTATVYDDKQPNPNEWCTGGM